MAEISCQLYPSSFSIQELLLLHGKLEAQESFAMLPMVWSSWIHKADLSLFNQKILHLENFQERESTYVLSTSQIRRLLFLL